MTKIIELPKNLKLPWKEKTIAFDFETTGLSQGKGTKKDDETNDPDRAIEVGYILFENGKETARVVQRFNPEGKKSGKMAFKAHGIKDEELLSEPIFKECSSELRQLFEEYPVIMGYNVEFDLKFIKAEFKRAGEKDFSWSNRLVIDPLQIWKNTANDKKLTTAFLIFVGGKFENAHSAMADISATAMVAESMCDTFGIGTTAEAMAEASFPKADSQKNIDTNQVVLGDNRFLWGNKEQVIINFGKYINEDFASLAKGEKNSDDWYLREFILVKNFPPEIKEYAQILLEGKKLPEKRHIAKTVKS